MSLRLNILQTAPATSLKQTLFTSRVSQRRRATSGSATRRAACHASAKDIKWQGIHHTGFICESLERSLEFYGDILGLEINEARPDDRLPYRGAWFWLGEDMIHLMELPNPDTTDLNDRPVNGGRDRHICVGIEDLEPLVGILDSAGVEYVRSASGRPAIFFRDPDANTIEVGQGLKWRGE